MNQELSNLGFSIISDFISKEEEDFILNKINKSNGVSSRLFCGRNSVIRYGSDNCYKTNIVSSEIPDYFDFLIKRLVSSKLLDTEPNSLGINEYLKGQGINPHIDNEKCGEIISVLSLLSDAVMIFKNKKEEYQVSLPARCLVQMRGKIRYDWTHEILPVENTRYSIVFRKN